MKTNELEPPSQTVRWYQYAFIDKQFFTKEFIKASVGFYQDEEHFRSAQNIAPERIVVKTNSYVDFPLLKEQDFDALKDFMDVFNFENKKSSQMRTDRIVELEKSVKDLQERILQLENQYAR